MLSRKFEVEQSDGVLTIRTSASGLIGRRVNRLMDAIMSVVALTAIYSIARIFITGTTHGLNGEVGIVCSFNFPVLIYHIYFGSWTCVFDAGNDQFSRGGSKPSSLSTITRARVRVPAPSILLRSLGFRTLVLETTTGRDIMLLYGIAFRAKEQSGLEELAQRINAFLAEHPAEKRNVLKPIWEWDQGKSVQA